MQWTSNILTPHALLLNAIHLLQATADIKDLRHQDGTLQTPMSH